MSRDSFVWLIKGDVQDSYLTSEEGEKATSCIWKLLIQRQAKPES